ncbi:hypothetical protein GF339_10885 [candidate division KSB3 bacterium]|uniref:Uncharacterized protein n=1 Tax=candidate division KSB3 bacterium TaxID=2044937 RepID=A0A9D5Q6N1_9BACT|nr:hypothetical protein [candidate division KSB3 bacterium]MBD3325081.1 hypothetical protein [candidate division KSB3 bacterium]
MDKIADRVAAWKAMGDSLAAYFYLYIIHVLKVIDENSTFERERTEDLLRQCSEKARHLRNRKRSIEWLGEGNDMRRLIHFGELGGWDRDKDFIKDDSKLVRVKGYIHSINGPEAGTIELLSCGLSVFFVPAKAKMKDREAGATKNHINVKVSFYLGFSYDGLRAWSVDEE